MNKFNVGDKMFHSKLTGTLTVMKAWVQPASDVPGATWPAFACYILRDQYGEDFTTGEEACMTAPCDSCGGPEHTMDVPCVTPAAQAKPAGLTSEQKAEACLIFHDCKSDAYEHAGQLINAQGGAREGRMHRRLAERLAIAFVACELCVPEAEVEAVLKGEGEIE